MAVNPDTIGERVHDLLTLQVLCAQYPEALVEIQRGAQNSYMLPTWLKTILTLEIIMYTSPRDRIILALGLLFLSLLFLVAAFHFSSSHFVGMAAGLVFGSFGYTLFGFGVFNLKYLHG